MNQINGVHPGSLAPRLWCISRVTDLVVDLNRILGQFRQGLKLRILNPEQVSLEETDIEGEAGSDQKDKAS